MVDTASQGEKTLERVSDIRFNLLRRHAGIKRRHHNHGDVDVGEQIHRHACHGRYPDHGNDQAQHDDEKRVFDGEPGHA